MARGDRWKSRRSSPAPSCTAAAATSRLENNIMSTLGLGSFAADTVASEELTLADVLARGVALEWFEAVAVVRATIENLGASVEQCSTPDLGQIYLGRDGAVRLSGSSYDDAPVRRLGQLLLALLNQADPPVTLRLIGSNATAPLPIYGGLQQ